VPPRAPDLIILDLTLPDGDGFSLVDWLRRQPALQALPLVVYSSREISEAEMAEAASRAHRVPRQSEDQAARGGRAGARHGARGAGKPAADSGRVARRGLTGMRD
jgi:CheY-like chemotaxis protein